MEGDHYFLLGHNFNAHNTLTECLTQLRCVFQRANCLNVMLCHLESNYNALIWSASSLVRWLTCKYSCAIHVTYFRCHMRHDAETRSNFFELALCRLGYSFITLYNLLNVTELLNLGLFWRLNFLISNIIVRILIVIAFVLACTFQNFKLHDIVHSIVF